MSLSKKIGSAAYRLLSSSTPRTVSLALPALVVAALGAAFGQGLPPVPVPAENPISESKRLLGKILFWEERLSANNTISCGTCHAPGRSGTDGRFAINPGIDGIQPSPDDIRGSLGIVHLDQFNQPVPDPVFGNNKQVTRRSANSSINAAYAPLLFWDGRAGDSFIDPLSGAVSISSGGALESQSLAPIVSSVEMGHDQRAWSEVTRFLNSAEPLGNATRIPADLKPSIAAHVSYPDLFQNAFGDRAITPERIAYAIATYERTTIANQTPWDRFIGGDPTALTPGQQRGWDFFRNSACSNCHRPPEFTGHTFRVIGVRPPGEDRGRAEVTGNDADRGKFKVPTLRGVGLKSNFMHNGRLNTLQDVIAFYRPNNPDRFSDNIDPLLPVPVPPPEQPPLIDFLSNGLTDPRLRNEQFPFDHPTLHNGNMPLLFIAPDKVTLNWPLLPGVASYRIYRGDLDQLLDQNGDGLPDQGYGDCINGLDPNPSDNQLVDNLTPLPGRGYFYLKAVIDDGTERGLGTTSSGLLRVPRSSCQ